MGQVNVNPGPSRDSDAGEAVAGMSAGMMIMLAIGVIVLLLLAFFWLRPMFGGAPSDINVNVRSSELVDALLAYI
jgi:hypothetical protein